MAAASELLKDLPSRDSTNFSQYNHTSFKSCESKRYIRLKRKDEEDTAQVIHMDENSLLTRELLKLEKKQSTKKPVKRANNNNSNSNHSRKQRKRDNESADNHSNSDNETAD